MRKITSIVPIIWIGRLLMAIIAVSAVPLAILAVHSQRMADAPTYAQVAIIILAICATSVGIIGLVVTWGGDWQVG